MKNSTRPLVQRYGIIFLILSSIIAITTVNSKLNNYYYMLENVNFGLFLESFKVKINFHNVINEGLMTLYFFMIGMDVKHEFYAGIFKKKSKIIVPITTAISGVITPAILYFVINYHHDKYVAGWAIPTATDIAFTLGILGSFNSKIIPLSTVTLIKTIAVFDDIIATVIIATIYSETIMLKPIICIIIILLVSVMNARRNNFMLLHLINGVLIWICLLNAGINTTLAGIIMAIFIPQNNLFFKYKMKKFFEKCMIFIILPIFTFVNTGVNLEYISTSLLYNPIFLGIFFGLVVGKPIGIFIPLYFFNKIKELKLQQMTSQDMLGIAFICGIGFTMSIFISNLAFHNDVEMINTAKIGILFSSALAALIGCFVLVTKNNFLLKTSSNKITSLKYRNY